MSRFALEGVRLLDFSWVGVGPVTTKYLADNGADVIRVESQARPDVLRLAPPWKDGVPGVNRSQFFASYNTSKKGIVLDLAKPRARELVLRLLEWADIVAESFTPKVMKGWGLDYENLRRVKPEIIMLSTCLQGQTGPNALYPGFGQLMAGLSGFYHISGYAEGSVCPPYGAYSDFIVPRFAAAALLAALDYRRRTGAGQYIDVSQFEAALHFLAPALIDYFATARVLGPQGNRSDRYAPHGAYRCADESGRERWIALAVADDREWLALLRVLGRESSDPRLVTMQERLRQPQPVDDLVSALVRPRQCAELVEALQGAGVCAYAVQNCVDLHADPNLNAFDFWHWLDHKEMGPSPYEGLQHRLSGTPGELRSPAPVLGEHNDEVFRDLLGLSDQEIAELKREQIIF